jgi:hypothetical protein
MNILSPDSKLTDVLGGIDAVSPCQGLEDQEDPKQESKRAHYLPNVIRRQNSNRLCSLLVE